MQPLYKVMLVDDEEEVRKAVIRKLDWAALGFSVCGEASNGAEALEMAERLEPDVIMTDIKMPFMDGLELCRRVKKALPGTRIAILTGFDEFEYAREAVTQQVEDYILKPIDAEEMAAIFRRIHQSLDEEIERRRDMERLRRHYEESLPLLRQQALMELLFGNLPAGQAVAALADRGIDIRADAYCAAVIRHEPNDTAGRLLSLSLEELTEETLPESPRRLTLQMPTGLAVLFLLDAGTPLEAVSGALTQLFPLSRKLLGVKLHIGIGKVYRQPEALARSYQEAQSALAYQYLLEPGQCIYIGDIEPGAGAERLPDAAYLDALMRQIKVGSQADLQKAVNDLVSHLRASGISPQQYQIYLLEVMTSLLKLIRTYRLNEREARLHALVTGGVAMRMTDLAELSDWLMDFCDNLRKLARKERKDSVRLLVERAREIMEAQYMDYALSLEQVCAKLNVSTAYFSTIFKRETGQGFVGYLTGLRMDKATELLRTTDEKTYQIAEKIGYQDPNYFSYVFKKRFGISPSRYRTGKGAAAGGRG